MPTLSPVTSQSAPGTWAGGNRPMANGVQLPLEANSLSRCVSANEAVDSETTHRAAAMNFMACLLS